MAVEVWAVEIRRLLIIAAAALAPLACAQANTMKLLHAERSLYREVLVYDTGPVRCMFFTRHCRIGRQSCMDMRQPNKIVMNYPQMMLGALYVQPAPRTVLIIGLGGGTLPRALAQILPQTQMEVVEIDPAVVRVAK